MSICLTNVKLICVLITMARRPYFWAVSWTRYVWNIWGNNEYLFTDISFNKMCIVISFSSSFNCYSLGNTFVRWYCTVVCVYWGSVHGTVLRETQVYYRRVQLCVIVYIFFELSGLWYVSIIKGIVWYWYMLCLFLFIATF